MCAMSEPDPIVADNEVTSFADNGSPVTKTILLNKFEMTTVAGAGAEPCPEVEVNVDKGTYVPGVAFVP